MRALLIVSTSEGKAARRAESILDRHLHRFGPSVWMGGLSEEAEAGLEKALRATASRLTQVVCRTTRDGVVRWIVGSAQRLSAMGQAPIHVRSVGTGRPKARPPATAGLRRLLLEVSLSALLHDLGKGVPAFQDSLRQVKPPPAHKNAIRHEVLSVAAALALRARQWTSPASDDALSKAVLDRLERGIAAGDGGKVGAVFGAAVWEDPVLWSVLCHHRLPTLLMGGDLYPVLRRHHRPVETAHLKGLRRLSPFDAKPVPIARSRGAPWHSEDGRLWLRRLRSVARRLEILPPLPTSGQASLYLLPALVMGDHLASAEARGALADLRPDAVLAKSTPAVPLVEHLLSVEEAAQDVLRLLISAEWPSLSPARLAALVPPPDDSRFGWQADALARIRGAVPAEAGLLAFVIARTGSGKTRGAALLAAAREQGARWTLLLGLRSLTRQSYDAYRRQIHLSEDEVALRMGGALGRPSADGNLDADALDAQAVEGAEQDLRMGEESVEDILAVAPADRPSPRFLSRLCRAASGGDGARLRAFLEAPVAVATVDMVMSALSERPHMGMRALLRLASSDVILDEIDGYDATDQAALLRLAYAVGAYGRRLILVSATLPQETAVAFLRAYEAGTTLRRFLCPGPPPALAVLSDLPGVSEVSVGGTIEDRHDFLENGLANHRRALMDVPPPRRLSMLPMAPRWAMADRVAEAVREAHRCHGQDISGRRVSVGFIRCATVDAARALARALGARAEEGDVRLRIICYHARLPTVVRDLVEGALDAGLQRAGGVLPLAESAPLRRALADAPEGGVAVVVVCTPILETGRDHDYDWAILDVSEARAVIQAAGRVRRHRPGPPPAAANVLLLSETLRAWLSGRAEDRYLLPGVRTLPPTKTLQGLMADVVPPSLPDPAIALGLDPADVFPVDLVFRNAPLQQAERLRLARVLGVDAASPHSKILGVVGLDAARLLDTYTYRHDVAPFRSGGGIVRRFWPIEDGSWRAFDPLRPRQHAIYTTSDVEDEPEIPGAFFSTADVAAHRLEISGRYSRPDARLLDGMDVQERGGGVRYVYTPLTGLGRVKSRWREAF